MKYFDYMSLLVSYLTALRGLAWLHFYLYEVPNGTSFACQQITFITLYQVHLAWSRLTI